MYAETPEEILIKEETAREIAIIINSYYLYREGRQRNIEISKKFLLRESTKKELSIEYGISMERISQIVSRFKETMKPRLKKIAKQKGIKL